MTRVRIAVAAHEVDVEADERLEQVAVKALYLYEKTSKEAERMHIGFDVSSGQFTLNEDQTRPPAPDEEREK